MTFGLRGPCQSIIGSRTAGLDALHLASMRISLGHWDQAIVCAGEEHCPLVQEVYHDFGLKFDTCAVAVALLVESDRHARSRGAPCRGVVDQGFAVHYGDRPDRGVRILSRALAGSNAERVISPTSGTWLDRLEALALRTTPHRLTGLNGLFVECFSGGALLAMAGLSLTKDCPGHTGPGPERVLVIASDFHGSTCGIPIRLDVH
jgi:hypothetical protein